MKRGSRGNRSGNRGDCGCFRRRTGERMRTRIDDEEGDGRAIMEKAIFILNVSMLWSKGYWF
jgi:hypothetical protein